MKKDGRNPEMPHTINYKLGSLELAIVALKRHVSRPQDIGMEPLRLPPTSWMMLLEAARLGAAEFYKNPQLIERLHYPFP